MYEKLAFLEERYQELSKSISDPEVIADQENWRKLMKEHSDISPIIEKYREYKKAVDAVADSKEMLKEESDAEMRELLQAEIDENEEKLSSHTIMVNWYRHFSNFVKHLLRNQSEESNKQK